MPKITSQDLDAAHRETLEACRAYWRADVCDGDHLQRLFKDMTKADEKFQALLAMVFK